MHFSSVFLLVNQEEPTITCPGCLHNVDIAAVLQCLKHGLIARYLLGVGPLATVCVCVCVHMEPQTEVIAESMEHCRIQL